MATHRQETGHWILQQAETGHTCVANWLWACLGLLGLSPVPEPVPAAAAVVVTSAAATAAAVVFYGQSLAGFMRPHIKQLLPNGKRQLRCVTIGHVVSVGHDVDVDVDAAAEAYAAWPRFLAEQQQQQDSSSTWIEFESGVGECELKLAQCLPS